MMLRSLKCYLNIISSYSIDINATSQALKIYTNRISLSALHTYIDPINMVLKVVNRMGNQLNVALLEVRLMDGNASQLSGADGSEITRMREENAPSMWDMLVNFISTTM